jgi:heme exporter protein D
MNYLSYVVAAYAVFTIVLAWDYVAPRLQVRQQLRAAKLRIARRVPVPEASAPLSRLPGERQEPL